MKFSLCSRIAIVAAALCVAGAASANTILKTYTPGDKDLDDLDHYYAYEWGFKTGLPDGYHITEATLTIKNIWDWTVEKDILNITMLDDPFIGTKQYYDNQSGGDFFAGKGVKVGSWSDPAGGKATGFDLVFDLKSLGLLDDLNAFAKDGTLGFGFDPDCHYYNDGVHLNIKAVPEPASMTLLAIGGAAALLRRRKAAKKA